MLAQRAVDEFFAQKLEDYDWIKEATREELLDAIQDLGGYDFSGPPPFLHQLACFYIGITDPGFLYFLDMGLGKSRIILDIIRFKKQQGTKTKALILVPNMVNIDNWCDEIELFTPDLTYTAVYGSSLEREETFKETDTDLYILNYAGLYALLKVVLPGKGKKKKWGLNVRKAHKFGKMFSSMTMDESTSVASQDSLPHRCCRIIAKHVENTYSLTGTPFGRDPITCWGQFYLVDKGETLGRTKGLCQQAFYDQKEGYWTKYTYTFRTDLKKEFYKRLKNKSIRYKLEDCVKIPRLRYKKVPIRLTVQQRTQYRALLKRVHEAKGNYAQLDSVFVNMRMLSSGFIRFKDEETGKRLDTDLGFNPKLDALEDIIKSIPEGRKMIIIYEYIHTGEIITKLLKKLKKKYVQLPSKKSVEDVRKFKRDKITTILLANWKSGSKGLNLQVANYITFFETPVSPIERAQCEKRIRRATQKRKCLIFDLVMLGIIDEKIYGYLKEGKDLFKALIDGKETWEAD